MPFTITRKRNHKYQVSSFNKRTGKRRIYAKNTTMAKAKRQVRLLQSLEYK
jgi:hypothetical protein